ncbi:MAG: haloacid dehalogenase [Phycisphaerae bacterium SM23_33]|nr:MAG: haloacid dehalogenase [Phycisphaerae bacterium SM23_33]
MDPTEKLKSLKPTKDFFVGIDSDGCAFDTMEIKHKECFIPNIINSWELQPVSRFAREAAEFVNLYSKWRGINRFPALVMVFDLLAEWDEPVARGYKPPPVDPLRQWIRQETKLGSPALQAKVAETADPVLRRALEWSQAVNADVAKIVRGVPPFPFVRDSLVGLAERADIIVVSATPGEALNREWAEHDIARYARLICGQEMGSKKEHIQYAAAGKYPPEKILMVGDAPGDLQAAKANAALFYPVMPGDEAASWKRFHDEAVGRFFAGRYAGDYEQALIADFDAHLPETPPWKN